MIDATREPTRRSWVESAERHPDFPVQNLPFGIFSPQPGETPRAGVRIGDDILDIGEARRAGLLDAVSEDADSAAGPDLNALFGRGRNAISRLRARIQELLDADTPDGRHAATWRHRLLSPAASAVMRLPARIGGFTDFYAGIHHATNTGRLLRPDNPLLPNYKYVPVAYHARASSVRASGTPVRRPQGQRKPGSALEPDFGASRLLDFELEMGLWVAGGDSLGEPIPVAAALDHVAGLCLLNDWSARDIQAWEYQPLGPFLAKNFATTVSPWVVTLDALSPFMIVPPTRGEADPQPLAYLAENGRATAFDIALYVSILTPQMRHQGLQAQRLSASNARHLYWSLSQMIAHHTCGGCNLEPGDLIGTGTISAPEPSGYGSMLELTRGGREPITLTTGEVRRFLEDDDEVIFTARAHRDGYASIGFGECRGRIVPAPGA